MSDGPVKLLLQGRMDAMLTAFGNSLRPRSARLRGLIALLGDRRGVAAVEFAFIVPVLLCMYFVTLEASQGIETNRKVSRIGSTVADLITQQTEVKAPQLVALMQVGAAVIRPYNRSRPIIEITAIQMGTEATPVARVAWSLRLNKTTNLVEKVANKTSIVTDADLNNIRAAGAFYIKVRTTLDYRPVIAWSDETAPVGLLSAFSNIKMGETFYLRPRVNSGAIPCSDCP